MISETKPAQFGLRPPAPAVAAANAAANRPSTEDIHKLADDMRKRHPGSYASAPSSLPGLGGHLDLYDTVVGKQAKGLYGGKAPESPFQVMDFSQGLSSFEPLHTPHDFPYLKPLSGRGLGKALNTLI